MKKKLVITSKKKGVLVLTKKKDKGAHKPYRMA